VVGQIQWYHEHNVSHLEQEQHKNWRDNMQISCQVWHSHLLCLKLTCLDTKREVYCLISPEIILQVCKNNNQTSHITSLEASKFWFRDWNWGFSELVKQACCNWLVRPMSHTILLHITWLNLLMGQSCTCIVCRLSVLPVSVEALFSWGGK